MSIIFINSSSADPTHTHSIQHTPGDDRRVRQVHKVQGRRAAHQEGVRREVPVQRQVHRRGVSRGGRETLRRFVQPRDFELRPPEVRPSQRHHIQVEGFAVRPGRGERVAWRT